MREASLSGSGTMLLVTPALLTLTSAAPPSVAAALEAVSSRCLILDRHASSSLRHCNRIEQESV